MRGFKVISHPIIQIWHRVILFLFPMLKELFKGMKFNSDEEIKAKVKRWFNSQTEVFYLDDISQLVKCWQCNEYV